MKLIRSCAAPSHSAALIPAALSLLFAAALVPSAGLSRTGTELAFTDTDGDSYVVQLTGPGTIQVSINDTGGGNGPINAIALDGTTTESSVKVSVTQVSGTNGTVELGQVTGAGSLKSFVAPRVNLSGAGIAIQGGLGELVLGDIADGTSITTGQVKGLSKTRISAARIGGAIIHTAGKLTVLTASAVEGAAIDAPAVGTVKVTNGAFDGALTAEGAIASLTVSGGDLRGRTNAESIGPIKVSKSRESAGGSIVDATIAAVKSIGPITVAGNIVNSRILAGADLGDDGALGGVDTNSDTFAQAKMASVKVGGEVTGSVVGAGLAPFDGVFGNGNDGIFGGKRSKLGALTIRGQLSADSVIGAGTFAKVKIGGSPLKLPQLDARFVTRRLEGVPPPAPDPNKNAPANDRTVPTNLAGSTEFLYTGSNAVQTGVTPGTIEPARAAVLRGKVLDRESAPLPAVVISILDHPEFGETMSRADGMFDLAVNGGGQLSVRYEKEGFMAVQRQLQVAQQDYTTAPDVALSALDTAVTPVAFGAAAPMQMHEGTMQTDADGQRHAALMFTPGTSASLVMPDGTTEPMSSLKIRATEYTVGAMGPKAMPAALPPTSAYTYCVELSADEAVATGATSVRFDKPVWMYVENFLKFPAGTDVPIGFFDESKGVWVAGQSGLVIKIVSITGGSADLDVTGDGVGDSGAALGALGITDPERQQLAARYAAGQSLWRALIPHFSTVDANWSGSPGNPAGTPNGGKPKRNKKPNAEDDECLYPEPDPG